MEKDEAEAVRLWRSATERNQHLEAEVNLANCLHVSALENATSTCFPLRVCKQSGVGVAPDFVEAVRLLRNAAARGHARAQFNLASCYFVRP
jgi:TPR repeat protein